ncbi:MAG: DUF1722 domain-containing protein [Nitrosopumilaceae archaeon]
MKRTTEGMTKSTFQMPKLTEKDIAEYVLERFYELKEVPRMQDLVTFHSNNKYLIMAHSQVHLKELGNVVANHEKQPLKKVLNDYQKILITTLKIKPTVKTHINALMHIFGFFGKYLSQKEKTIFMQFIKGYREDKIKLGKILSEIEPITYKINNLYLISQTYFLLYSDPNMGNVFNRVSIKSFRD